MLLLYGGGAAAFALWQYPPARPLLQQHWPVAVVAIVGAIALRLIFRPNGERRVGYILFVVPSVLAVCLAGGAVLLQPHYRVAALRALFILVVTLLPPTMYYLFITTRKYSLLNEFVSNLHRLGLLESFGTRTHRDSWTEDECARRLRAMANLQKFEAAYGPLPPALVEEVRASGDVMRVLAQPRSGRLLSSGVAEVFTAENAPPLVLSTLLIALGWFAMLPPVLGDSVAWADAFVVPAHPVNYAFLGAYFFSIQMLFRRYVLRDLRASAYVAVALRIILAVLGAWVLMRVWDLMSVVGLAGTSTQDSRVLTVTAFVVGVFPPVAWEYVRAVLKKTTFAASAVPSLSSELPISDLDGLTVWHQSRLEEEDIENIPNMATASLVDLMLNTRVPPERLVDWVDQAILYTAIGTGEAQVQRRGRLRACGIRTASALVCVSWRRPDQARLMADTGETTPIDITVAALLTNPNLKLIQRWRGLPSEPMLLAA
jgi:hypothetical protein